MKYEKGVEYRYISIFRTKPTLTAPKAKERFCSRKDGKASFIGLFNSCYYYHGTNIYISYLKFLNNETRKNNDII